MLQVAAQAGVATEHILLREHPVDHCHNCRSCTQEPGAVPAHCVIHDGMGELVTKIEAADAYILAAPVNFGSATALFKRFMERLLVYAYWPWGRPGPVYRKAGVPQKKAALVSSCAAPGVMGYVAYDVRRQLKLTAKTIGAESVGTLITGLVAQRAQTDLSLRDVSKAQRLARKLL